MKAVTPFRLGMLGVFCCVGGVVWVAVWSYLAHRNDPPGWIIDISTPVAPQRLAALGAMLVVASLVWGVASWIGRRAARSTKSKET
jgi:hypothetical protein